MTLRLVLGIAASTAISAAGYRAGALSRGGALAAIGVGSAVIAGTGWRGATVLGTFFVSSSALSRFGHVSALAAKGGQRDARQVFANGGVAAVAALTARLIGERRALAMLTGALAAAAADTWATEIGSTSDRRPRTLLGRQVVEAGVSGGVTTRGLAGSVGGAALVSLTFATVTRFSHPRAMTGCFMAGLGGSLIDSLLGELVQQRRYCPLCKRATESRIHHCGTPTLRVGGLPGFDNDVVNLACTLTGAGIATWIAR